MMTIRRSAASRLKADPSQTYTLRKRFETEVKRRFNRFKSSVLDLVKREDAFGLTANFNPSQPRDNRGRWSSGSYTGETSRLKVSIKQQENRLFIEATRKSSELNWLDVGQEDKVVVEARVGLNPENKSLYLERIDSSVKGKGYGREVTKAVMEEAAVQGFESMQTYVQYSDIDSQNMMSKLGGIRGKETDFGVYWNFDLKPKELTANTRWKFRTNPQKVEEFRLWLQKHAEENLLQASDSTDPNKWWDEYVLEAYRKGQLSSFESVNKQKLGESMDFYKGTKEQFLRDSFAQPETKEKIQLLAGRIFTDLKGVTEAMATSMTRTLTDGLSQGQNPFTIARQLVKDIDGIGVNRARMIARTEVIRAHAEGQLDALETMGIEEVGVAVEWDDAGDGRVCKLCQAMSGVILTVKEAHGLIPRHPNCRCSFLPANVGESKQGQIRGPKGIQGAFDKSIKREIPKGSKRTLAEQKAKTSWGGADTKVVKKRPKSIIPS